MTPTNLQLATHYKLNKDTVQKWKKTRPEVYEALVFAYNNKRFTYIAPLDERTKNLNCKGDTEIKNDCFDYELYEKLMDDIKKVPSLRFIEKSVMRSTALNLCKKITITKK